MVGLKLKSNKPISIGNIEVTYYNVKDWSPPLYKTFSDIDLHEVVKQNIELCGYYAPTPIQRSCIPAIMKGNDIIACAQTGMSPDPFIINKKVKNILTVTEQGLERRLPFSSLSFPS